MCLCQPHSKLVPHAVAHPLYVLLAEHDLWQCLVQVLKLLFRSTRVSTRLGLKAPRMHCLTATAKVPCLVHSHLCNIHYHACLPCGCLSACLPVQLPICLSIFSACLSMPPYQNQSYCLQRQTLVVHGPSCIPGIFLSSAVCCWMFKLQDALFT